MPRGPNAIFARWEPTSVVLNTSLSRDECRDALRGVFRRWRDLKGPIVQWIGWVKDDKFAFWPAWTFGRYPGRGIARRFDGTLVASVDGTRIEGRIRLHPISWFVLAAAVILVVGTLGMLSAAAASSAFGFGLPSAIRGQVLPFLLVTAGGIAFLTTSEFISRGDRRRMLELLTRELHAAEEANLRHTV